MTNIHNKSFFGQKVGLILSSRSKTDPFIFLKFLKKKASNVWEKPSKGEGKTIKISIEEMITTLYVLYGKLHTWSGFHSFKDEKTSISLGWDEKKEIFWIRVDEYAKSLKFPQTEFFKLLLEHLIKEKVIFATSGNNSLNKKDLNKNNSNDLIDYFESDSFFENLDDFNGINKDEKFSSINSKKSISDNKKSSPKQTIKARLKNSTDKALLLIFGNGKEVWFPKSTINNLEKIDLYQNSSQQRFLIDAWILQKNDLVNN